MDTEDNHNNRCESESSTQGKCIDTHDLTTRMIFGNFSKPAFTGDEHECSHHSHQKPNTHPQINIVEKCQNQCE